MIRFRIYYDNDAAANWLNEMAKDGWNMTGFFAGIFLFEKCGKGAWQYQVDFRTGFGRKADDYRLFMEDAGIEVIQNWGFWTFLRKPASEKPFQLYTDIDSRLTHYKKILVMFKIITALEVLGLTVELLAALMGNRPAIAFAFVLGAISLILVNQVIRVKRIINKLKEQRDGFQPGYDSRRFSLCFSAGMFLNAIVLLSRDYIARPIRHVIQIAALILMVFGLFITFRNKNE